MRSEPGGRNSRKQSRRASPTGSASSGDKTGDDRFYDRMVPIAARLYDEHLEELKREGAS